MNTDMIPAGGPLRGVPRTAAPPVVPQKHVMIYDLMAAGRPIFVSFPPRDGLISGPVFQLHHPDHQYGVRLDPIPMGPAPIDLTAQIPHEHLKKCIDLYNAIRRGHLKLWDPDEAMEYVTLHQDEAEEARRRIDEIMTAERSIDPRFIVRAEGGSPEDMINPLIVAICQDVKGEQRSPEDALGELLKLEPNLEDMDIDYVYAWSGRYALQHWAQTAMARRNEDPEYQARREARNKALVEERRARGMAGDMAGVGSTAFDERGTDPAAMTETASILANARRSMNIPSAQDDPTLPR